MSIEYYDYMNFHGKKSSFDQDQVAVGPLITPAASNASQYPNVDICIYWLYVEILLIIMTINASLPKGTFDIFMLYNVLDSWNYLDTYLFFIYYSEMFYLDIILIILSVSLEGKIWR